MNLCLPMNGNVQTSIPCCTGRTRSVFISFLRMMIYFEWKHRVINLSIRFKRSFYLNVCVHQLILTENSWKVWIRLCSSCNTTTFEATWGGVLLKWSVRQLFLLCMILYGDYSNQGQVFEKRTLWRSYPFLSKSVDRQNDLNSTNFHWLMAPFIHILIAFHLSSCWR